MTKITSVRPFVSFTRRPLSKLGNISLFFLFLILDFLKVKGATDLRHLVLKSVMQVLRERLEISAVK